MQERRVSAVPVIDDEDRLVGIVSRADLLKVFLRGDPEIAKEIPEDVIRRTLWIDPITIRVVVHDGVVTVEGRVEWRSLIPVLLGLIHAVEGVVGVDSRLSFLIDDTAAAGDLPLPWTAIAPGPGR